MKARCENCPARNRNVRAYEIKSGELVVRRIALCVPCKRALDRLIAKNTAPPAGAAEQPMGVRENALA